jgi:hypothetical protein
MPVTPNYGINLPQPGDSMADVTDSFNAAWPIITNTPKPKAVVSGIVLPTSGYNVGDVIHLAGWRSNFILLAIDTHWGYMWRPIHAKFAPWINVASAVLGDAVNYLPSPHSNFSYRISNDGKIYFTGGFISLAAAWPTGIYNSFLQTPPAVVRPMVNMTWSLPFSKSTMGAYRGNTSAVFEMDASGTNKLTVWNNGPGVGGAGDANEIFFNEAGWAMGTRTDL